MPDKRKHRGPHPADAGLFGPDAWPALQAAVADHSWLLSRGYPPESSLKLVGDRFALTERQRKAVMRSSCSDQELDRRARSRLAAADLADQTLHLDGFNVLTTVEAALSGGVILVGRDGCYRDMASMHGSYRKVAETRTALELIGEVLAQLGVGECVWLLDSPVSNSGRLAKLIREVAGERGWDWSARLAADPDRELIGTKAVVASADSAVIDRCECWFNLAREVVERRIEDARIVPMGRVASGE